MTGPTHRLMPQQAPPATNGARPSTAPLAQPLSTRTRPKSYAALAVALIVGFGALGLYFYTSAGSKTAVVMAARDIPVGRTISRSDLTTTEVSGSVVAVGSGNLSTLVGQHASVGILKDTLVQRSMVANGSTVKNGQSLVGVAAVPGQIPSSGLAPGDKVQVLQLPDKGTDGGAGAAAASGSAANGAVLVQSATVCDVRANTTTAGGTLLTLIVPAQNAFGVAQASNNGAIAVVKIGG